MTEELIWGVSGESPRTLLQRTKNHLPRYYQESKILDDLYRAIIPELDHINQMLDTQSISEDRQVYRGMIQNKFVRSYEQAIKQLGAVRYWKFDRVQSTAFEEITANHGTYLSAGDSDKGQPSLLVSDGGRSLNFDATNHLTGGNSPVTCNSPMSAILWFKDHEEDISGQNYLISYELSFGSFAIFSMEPSGRTLVCAIDGATIFITSPEYDISQTHMIVLTIDSDGFLRGYLDGVLFGKAGPNTATPGSSAGPLIWIGSNPVGGAEYDGDIDEVSLFNKELKSNEILELYNLGIGIGLVEKSFEDKELPKYVVNQAGWGFERLANQAYIASTNHEFNSFRKLYDVESDFPNYISLRNRLIFVAQTVPTITPDDLAAEIALLGELNDVDEDFPNYAVSITIIVEDAAFQEVILERINRVVPAHLAITVITTAMVLNDSPVGKLSDDPENILL